jgi:hypothetical protein
MAPRSRTHDYRNNACRAGGQQGVEFRMLETRGFETERGRNDEQHCCRDHETGYGGLHVLPVYFPRPTMASSVMCAERQLAQDNQDRWLMPAVPSFDSGIA